MDWSPEQRAGFRQSIGVQVSANLSMEILQAELAATQRKLAEALHAINMVTDAASNDREVKFDSGTWVAVEEVFFPLLPDDAPAFIKHTTYTEALTALLAAEREKAIDGLEFKTFSDYARKAGMCDQFDRPYDHKAYHTSMHSFESARRIK